jgi:putative DNA modification/repair radical SAM protein
MNTEDKLNILSMSAKYDASCASSGSTRENSTGGIGNAAKSGVCHSWSDDGRCISLLKILQSNNCVYDCAYCHNRKTNDIKRATFTSEEVADLTINFYRRNYIEGLFLSSAVFRNPNYTMELMIKTVELLRNKYRFNGYIHMKAMPGADPNLIIRAGLYADRMSANIELPTQKSLALLAPDKTKTAILSAMNTMKSNLLEYRGSGIKTKSSIKFIPAGQSTQLIVGATPESDRTIITLSEALYNKFSLKRVYYSAYIPVSMHDSRLPVANPPLRRENRLYQADWLLRFYGFTASELLDEENPNFDPDLDPKICWAMRNMHRFPVEVLNADYETLLKVPGIGQRSARKIIRSRRVENLTFDSLKKIGVVMKRARYFITCRGKFLEKNDYETIRLKSMLIADESSLFDTQLSLFPQKILLPDANSVISAMTGEV